MVAVILAALLTVPKQEGGAVTFESKAVRLRSALETLGGTLGLKLACHDSMAAHWIVLKVDGATVDETLAMVAKTMDAKWEPYRDGRRLVPDPKGSNERWRPAVKKLLAQAEEARARRNDGEIRNDIERQISFNSRRGDEWDYNEYLRLRGLSPDVRFVIRAAATLGEAELLSALSRKRTVYSTKPTAAQRPLPAAVVALCREFIAEAERYNRVMAEVEAAGRTGEPGLFAASSVPVGQDINGLLLTFRTDLGSCEIQAVVDWASAPKDGLVPPSAFMTTINLSDDFKGTEGEGPLGGLQGEVEFSEHALWTLRVFAPPRRYPKAAPPEPSPFMDLIKHEPLAGLPSEIVLGVAKATGRNVVARFSDWALGAAVSGPGPDVKQIGPWARTLDNALAIDLEGERWILMRPEDGSVTETEFDRRGVVRLLGMPPAGPERVHILSEVAAGVKDAGSFMFTVAVASMLREGPNRFEQYAPFWVLRAFGSLGEPLRKKAWEKNGVTFALGSMPTPARQTIATALFEEPVWIRPSNEAPESDLSWSHVGSGENRHHPGPEAEPTARFPLGLPPDTIVRFRVEELSGLLVESPDSYPDQPQLADPESLAWREALKERDPGGYGHIGPVALFEGSLRRIVCSLEARGTLVHRSAALVADRRGDNQAWSIQEAPEDFRREYAKALEKARQQVKDWSARGQKPRP
jgi:hypothetical protein